MFSSRVALAGLLVLAAGAMSRLPGDDFKLPRGCKLPFDKIATKPDPFLSCGNIGSDKHGNPPATAKALEDEAKNNFCADRKIMTAVDFNILKEMQKQAPEKSQLSRSRQALHDFFRVGARKIGEGSVVRLKAFVKEAHISDCEDGEEVNCKQKGVAHNDFHIPLVDPTVSNPRDQDECTSVTAEMSPHFRPAAWSQIDLKTPVRNPVRVTGPLFFDDSHEPCTVQNGKLTGPNPRRISLWEIHPVYALEVCAKEDPAQCDAHSNSRKLWVPYNQWVKQSGAVTEATGEKYRRECEGAPRAREGSGKTCSPQQSGVSPAW